jgi:putative two-component system response regulator
MNTSSEREPRQASLLIIDDQPENIRLLVRILNQAGYMDITTTTDSSRVSELQALSKPDIVLLDLHMPNQDGFAVLEKLAPLTFGSDRLPVVMITGDDSSETKRRALTLGAKDFVSKPFDQAEVVLRIQNLLETRFLHQQLRKQNNELEQKVAARTKELQESQMEMLERLATAVEFRDDDTGDHTKRVGLLSGRLAEAIGVGTAAAELVRRAAPLHDIGKVGISDAILLKPGPLTPEERAIMQTHTTIGSKMLSKGRSELVRLCQRIARSHHERWDGSGYPDGLVEQDIPLEARIVAVADFFDALTHERPYREAWTAAETLDAISAASGSHFDPVVVDALTRIDRNATPDSLAD